MYGGKDGSLKTGEEAIMTAHVEVMMAYTRLVAVEVVRKGWDSFVQITYMLQEGGTGL